MNKNIKTLEDVRERERESNNLGECRGEHCSSICYGNDPIDVGTISISHSTKEYSNNKAKHYAKTKSTRVGAAFGSPFSKEQTQENKKIFNMAMPKMFGRPNGAPTENKNNKMNNISDCQRQPLQNTRNNINCSNYYNYLITNTCRGNNSFHARRKWNTA